jgi:Mg-chelatase subunit ChlD
MEEGSAQWKWRLILGREADIEQDIRLEADWMRIDEVLEALYEGGDRRGGLGSSSPNVNRWLGDIRRFFPSSVVQVMQKDALERLNLKRLLAEPEILESFEPDIHLAATLLSLNKLLPDKSRETAREVVRKIVEELQKKLEQPLRNAIRGSLNKSSRNHRPRLNEVDWRRTIQRNLKHYQPELKAIIPERLVGFGKKRHGLKRVVLLVDQSGSMAASVVYAGIFGAILASLPSLHTQVIAFDSSVADLTEFLDDPVELLFGTQLGGGTDIGRALAYAQTRIDRPEETVLILISDLFEGGRMENMMQRTADLLQSGVRFICLLALDDEGAPGYNREIAGRYAEMGIPSFACTPELFPGLMATALNRGDLHHWMSQNGIVPK